MDSEEEIEYEAEEFCIADLQVQIQTISFLPIEQLLQLETKSEEISGQRVWTGSLMLCAYLLQHKAEVAGRNILELGSGSGIAGIVAQKLGAKVCYTDADPKSLELLQTNVTSNGCDGPVRYLNWFEDNAQTVVQEAFGSETPYLIAADVLYKEALLEPFFDTVLKVLPENKHLLLCHIPRASVAHEVVTDRMTSKGLRYEQVVVEGEFVNHVLQYCEDYDRERARLYIVRR